MSSFAGVSVVTGGKHCTTSAVNAGMDSGYHLLVVKDYSRTVQEIPNGEGIKSGPFMVGGHPWRIWYSPNGEEPSCADFISLSLYPVREDDNMEEAVEAKFEFSFVDQVNYQKPIYIRATETYSFSVKCNCWGCMRFIKRDALERSTYLKDDCFTIRCDIMVLNASKDVDGALSDIHDHFNILLESKMGADVTFKVSGETFAAHRYVLAARSKVFMAQLFGPMTEGNTPSVIHIKDMEVKVFAALLSFIYTDSFPFPEMEEDKTQVLEKGQQEEAVGPVMLMQWLQDLFVAADRYDIQQLKLLCEKQLSEHIDVSSVASTLALAEQHHCQRLKEACFKFIQVQSPESLDKVMSTDGWEHTITTYPSVLKELLAKLVSNQKKGKKRKH